MRVLFIKTCLVLGSASRACLRTLALALVTALWCSLLALGAEPQKHLYLLSNPIELNIELGPTARIAHHVIPTIDSPIKIGMLYAATGEPLAAVSYSLFEASKAVAQIRLQSTLDLRFRTYLARRKRLQELARTPGIERTLVLTAAELKYSGLVARKSESKSFIFVETSAPLEELPASLSDLGSPIEIEDLDATRVRLRLQAGENEHPHEWETSLREIFGATPMPEDVEKSWVEAIRDHDKAQNWRTRHLTKSHEADINVRATLVYPDGEEQELGSVMQAQSVRKLLGQSLYKKAAHLWHALWGNPEAAKGRIPVTIVPCERILREE